MEDEKSSATKALRSMISSCLGPQNLEEVCAKITKRLSILMLGRWTTRETDEVGSSRVLLPAVLMRNAKAVAFGPGLRGQEEPLQSCRS
jgi:hypothetical protein